MSLLIRPNFLERRFGPSSEWPTIRELECAVYAAALSRTYPPGARCIPHLHQAQFREHPTRVVHLDADACTPTGSPLATKRPLKSRNLVRLPMVTVPPMDQFLYGAGSQERTYSLCGATVALQSTRPQFQSRCHLGHRPCIHKHPIPRRPV